MGLKETVLFLRGAATNLAEVGSIIPSSRAVAKAMTSALREKPAPRRILEVGAGTGPITARIVREMRPGDHLDIYEINPEFTAYLERRFAREPRFRQVRDQVTIHTAGIETIARQPTYDVIISAIPFTNFPPAAVKEFFETYRVILKPGGRLTYIEFAFGRTLLRKFGKKEDRQRLESLEEILRHYQRSYRYRARFVPLNAPPARIHSLHFDR
jgi:phospholipid N-methyltransferase